MLLILFIFVKNQLQLDYNNIMKWQNLLSKNAQQFLL